MSHVSLYFEGVDLKVYKYLAPINTLMDDDGSLEDSVEAGEADQVILDVHQGPPVLPCHDVAEVPDMSFLSTHIALLQPPFTLFLLLSSDHIEPPSIYESSNN